MLGLLDRSRSWIAVMIAFVVTLLLGAVACEDVQSGGIPPTTGILIRAETLTTGKGCGLGPTQVFKYVVVVFRYTDGDPQSRNSYRSFQAQAIFDCYVDGEFVSLPTDVGNSIYRLEVYAFNQSSYSANRALIETAVKSTNDTDPTNDQASSDAFRNAIPTWTTECTATQLIEVEALAQCDPLSPGLGGVGDKQVGPTQIQLATQSFRLPDGRLAVCAPGAAPAGDAGSDAADAASDASDAAASDASDAAVADAASDADAAPEAGLDAGTPTQTVPFSKVRIRTRIGGTIVKDSVDVACDAQNGTFLTEVDAEPSSYVLDVGLIDGAGQPIGQTACNVTTTTGAVNVAVCP